MTVSLTTAAVERAKRFIEGTPGALGLRFGVKKSGCSGFAYVIDVATDRKSDDAVFISNGVAVHVDAQSLAHVADTEIDFVKNGLNQQFVFRNPKVTGECGCGESFTTA